MARQHRNSFRGKSITEHPFPWSDVEACMDSILDSKEFLCHLSCPQCGRDSDRLTWIDFTSPDSTWAHLCGRMGPLSICPQCNIQVEFICDVMN